MKSFIVIISLLFAGCDYFCCYDMSDKPNSVQLMSQRYVTKVDLFLVERDLDVPWIEVVNYKYTLEPPGVWGRTPNDVDTFLKYGNDWSRCAEKSGERVKATTVIAVIPAGTSFRITRVQRRGALDAYTYYSHFFGYVDDPRFCKDLIQINQMFDIVKDSSDQFTFRANPNFIEPLP